MASRIAVVVGCNQYIHLTQLFGAHNDAERMYSALVDPKLGAYDAAKSVLLLSPSVDGFRAALEQAIFQEDGVEVLTIFFAGHGGIKSGSYYLCMKETNAERMSTSGYPLNALFTSLNESRPAQVNIIIDACNAGGLVADLGTLLKLELIGAKGSPSISLLASASADEYANEVNGGGVVTGLVLEHITGVTRLNTSTPYLDLTDIAKGVSATLQGQHKQTPTAWGLNLYGQSRFTKNPHFYPSNSSITDSFGHILPNSDVGRKISQHTEVLWDEYRLLADRVDAVRLGDKVDAVVDTLSDDANSIASFVGGIATTLEERSGKGADLFAPITVISVLATALMRYLDNAAVRSVFATLSERRRALIAAAVREVNRSLEADPYYLLDRSAGLADLFYLPIRLTKLLGNAWGQVLIDNLQSVTDQGLIAEVLNLTSSVLDKCAGSLVAVSDEQAPYLYIALRGSEASGNSGALTPALGHIIQDALLRRGRIADAHLKAEEVLDFLLTRAAGRESIKPQLLANPSALIAVILSARLAPSEEDALDRALRQLDHRMLVVFIPSRLTDFAARTMREGVNNVFQIGHGIWTLADFRQQFAIECVPAIMSDISSQNVLVRTAAIMAALVFPDRVPWFLDATQE